MIEIDRASDTPLHLQLFSQLRFQIANGQLRAGTLLPSTRVLAAQLDLSFHTVRKAYSALERDGYARSEVGRGYVVEDFKPSNKSQRLEDAAVLVREMIQKMIGLGLEESDIEYLIQEQMDLLEAEEYPYKIVAAGPFREWGERCAAQLGSLLQKPVTAATLEGLSKHADADFVLVPFSDVRQVLTGTTNADVVGLQTELDATALGEVSRLLERETLGLVTRHADAIGPLTSRLRSETRFSGQVLAVSVDGDDSHIEPLLRQCDLILYTVLAEKKLHGSIPGALRHFPLELSVSPTSVQRLRKLIPA